MKNNRGYLYIILGLIIIIIAASLLGRKPPEANAPTLSTVSDSTSYKDLVRVSNLKAGDTIRNGFVLKGEARGTWFFEAVFSVKVVDKSGKVLGQAPATALSEWTTPDYVPFSSTLNFSAGKETEGFVVLEKDNPSGLPEKDDSFRIPVRFEI